MKQLNLKLLIPIDKIAVFMVQDRLHLENDLESVVKVVKALEW